MTREVKILTLHGFLGDRSRDKHVDIAVGEGFHGHVEGSHSCAARLRRGSPGSMFGHLRGHFHHADAPGLGCPRVGGLVETRIVEVELATRFLGQVMEAEHHGSAEIEHLLMAEGSEYHLVADAVDVAVGDTHFYRLIHWSIHNA